jgi:hypothetical protein
MTHSGGASEGQPIEIEDLISFVFSSSSSRRNRKFNTDAGLS